MKKKHVNQDLVVEEVRAIRADLWVEAGGTVGGLIRLLDRKKAVTRKARAEKRKPTFKGK